MGRRSSTSNPYSAQTSADAELRTDRSPVIRRKRSGVPRGQVFVPFFDESLLVNELTLDALVQGTLHLRRYTLEAT
jgi:hypothetical protein